MKWILGGLGLFTCVIFGLLGLTAGINLNPQSTVKFVPNWGSLGDWVSGFGAFMAVAASFLLVRRNEAFQTEREKEKIEIDQWATDFFFSIRVLSKGLFPSTVKAAYLSSEGKGVVSLCNSLPQDLQITLPKRLECREDIQFACRIDQLNTLLENISWLQLEDLNLLRIHVITVTDEYVVPINQEIADFFLGAARGARIAILGTDEPF